MDLAKVLLVDDHSLFRHRVRAIIDRERDLQTVGETGDCQEALLLARDSRPDLILIDICLSDGNGLETIPALKQDLPNVKIVVLTVHDEAENLFLAFKAGAQGFLSKGVRANILLESLRSVMQGDQYIMTASHSSVSRDRPAFKT
jgi:DNA-binding NarL/FixJ family response regulator